MYTLKALHVLRHAMQEVSSISGRVLDSWALHKPRGWQPNLLARAIAQQLFISNYTKTSWIEDPGEASSQEPTCYCVALNQSLAGAFNALIVQLLT